MVSFKQLVVFSSPLVALTACGGGGSGGSAAIVGLEPPAAMEVITVDTQGGAPATVAARAIVDFAPDCDYNTDASREHVWDPAIKPIATINEILCYMSQTGAAEMVNTGPYNAQLDEARCQTGSDPSSSSEGQSSGGNGVQPSIWVVDSTRADNDSPQLVDIWVPNDNQGGAGHIYVQCTINAGPTTANPYGDFFMNFAGIPDVGGDIDNPNEWGTLSTTDASGAQTGFSFYQSHGDVNQVPAQGEGAETTAVTVQFNADQTAGQARLSRLYRYNDPMGGDTGIQSEEFLLDVAGDEVLRQLGNDVPQCYSRTQFNYNTYRYNLYELDGANAGQRVELNSGFPIRKNGYYGWLGYWGVWMPPAADLQNGDIVERVEYGSATVSNYTIVQAPGKLIKFTRNQLLLVDGEGQTFDWWSFNGGQPERFQVELTGSVFMKVAEWDDQGQVWEPLLVPEQIDTASLGFLNMYSQSLGGPVGYVDGDTSLTYFAQEFINGSSTLFDLAVAGDVALYGYTQCLDSAITGAEAEMGDVFLADSYDVNTPYLFQFSQASLTLYQDVNGDGSLLTQVGLADGEAPAFGPFTWGLRSGPLVTDPSGLVNTWDLWNQSVFYQYETGPNAWNQYTTAMDDQGAFVVFDSPLQFSYRHATANDANGDSTYDDQTFQLNYGGVGNLWGLPSVGSDFDGDGDDDRFFPACSLVDGTELTANGVTYVVRAIESELTLLEVLGGCGTLDTANAAGLTLPTAADYTTPNIGPKPVVNAPPAVIEGVVQ